jgi:CRISPR-associated endonuclease/helicase Cas3
MPEDARLLIESVYGEDKQYDIPEALFHRSTEAEGSDRADASIARLNALSIDVGYTDSSTNRWWDEAKTPTRLGEETTMVYLAKWRDGVLLPWSDAKDHVWQLSAVSMRTYWIASEATTSEITQSHIDRCKASLPAKGKWGVLLPLKKGANGDWFGCALNERKEITHFFYNKEVGLTANPKRT